MRELRFRQRRRRSLGWLGWLLQEQGDLTAARSLLESVLSARERTLGPDHHDVAVDRNPTAQGLWPGRLLPGWRTGQQQRQ